MMLGKKMKVLTFALLAAFLASVLYADDKSSQEAESSEPIPAARSFVTTHSARSNGAADAEYTRIFIQQQLVN